MVTNKDQNISMLNKLGFDVVRYPKTGILPLDFIIQESKRFVYVPSIVNVWTSKSPVPKRTTSQAPALNVIESTLLQGSVGVSALIEFFKGRVNVSGLKDKDVKLVATKPIRISCDFRDLANYIQHGVINKSDALSEYFYDKHKKIYVLLEVLATSELKIIISGKSTGEVEASVKELSENISANVAGSISSYKNNEIIFQSESDLATFAFRHCEIHYSDHWHLGLPPQNGDLYFEETSTSYNTLLTPNERIELESYDF